mmetsp:Transcript_20990/g.51511  ORF Transcript_20990/g.51511 Transcript_20990/m.51511 type:complete len:417 (-) Transcript_20990:1065-2315(-)
MQQTRTIASQSIACFLILCCITFISIPLWVDLDRPHTSLQSSVASLRACAPTLPVPQLAINRTFKIIAHGLQSQRRAISTVVLGLVRRDLGSQEPLHTASRTAIMQQILVLCSCLLRLAGIIDPLLLQDLSHLCVHALAGLPRGHAAIIDLQPGATSLLGLNRNDLLLQLLRSTHSIPQRLQLTVTVIRLLPGLSKQVTSFLLNRSNGPLRVRLVCAPLGLDTCTIILLRVHSRDLGVQLTDLFLALTASGRQQKLHMLLLGQQLSYNHLQLVSEPIAIRIVGHRAEKLRTLLTLAVLWVLERQCHIRQIRCIQQRQLFRSMGQFLLRDPPIRRSILITNVSISRRILTLNLLHCSVDCLTIFHLFSSGLVRLIHHPGITLEIAVLKKVIVEISFAMGKLILFIRHRILIITSLRC